MPIPESNPAAALAFDAAVSRARARRLSDTPYPSDAEARRDDIAVESGILERRPQRAQAGAEAA
ncbi:MAG: hypothetical protein QM761_02495 [Pseudoxanthomonas sp.]